MYRASFGACTQRPAMQARNSHIAHVQVEQHGSFVSVRLASRKQLRRLAHAHRPAAVSSHAHAGNSPAQYVFQVPNEDSMAHLAKLLGAQLQPGDCYCLHGEVGAGKSVFSRAFIRAAMDDDTFPVTSPTFLLHNVYDEPPLHLPIHHLDLYRLANMECDVQRIGLSDALHSAVCLVEWAERLQGFTPSERLDVHIMVDYEPPAQAAAPATAVAEAAAVAGAEATATPAGWMLEAGAGDDESDPYTDKRQRVVVLRPYGPRWQQRVDKVMEQAQHADARACGLLLRSDLASRCSPGEQLAA